MTESKIETMKGICVVDITKYIMNKLGYAMDKAYSEFMNMELYKLLMDTDSGMYLEPNEFLYECFDIEKSSGTDSLYEYIQQDCNVF